MQIHEITKQKLNEGPIASSFLSGVASGATSALSKVGIVGPDASAYAGSTTGGANDQAGAQQATASLVASMTPVMAKSWGQTVAKIMSQSEDPVTGAPVTSVEKLDDAAKQMLRKELYSMINKSISRGGSFDYEKLGDTISDRGSIEYKQAFAIKNSISKDAEEIWTNTLNNVKSTALTKMWENLIQSGIAPAISFLKFKASGEDSGAGSYRENPTTKEFEIMLPGKSAWEKYDPANPAHLKFGRDKGFAK